MNAMNSAWRDDVTITLRRDELRDIIITLTATLDESELGFEMICERFPILANGYDRLCEQAQRAGVPILDLIQSCREESK